MDVDDGDDGGHFENDAAGGEDEASLPKATVAKLITDMLPAGVSCPRETRELLSECCIEFIHLISSEANEQCERSHKKTISPDHVIESLRELGFASFIARVKETYGEAQTQAKETQRVRASNKLDKSGLTEEELLKQQEELFESARRKYHQAQGAAAGSDRCSSPQEAASPASSPASPAAADKDEQE